jgi:hypothetical protein
MVTCPHCGTVLSIDVDGNIDVGSEPQPEPPPSQAFEEPLSELTQRRIPLTDQLQQTPDEPQGFQEMLQPEYQPQELTRAIEPPVEEPIQDFEMPPEPHQAPDLQEEVRQFAERNSADGLLLYTVTVEGIDSIQIRQAVILALSDSRFGFTPEDLQKLISRGKLVLKDLNPGQAVMTVRKLRVLPVEISWRQNEL